MNRRLGLPIAVLAVAAGLPALAGGVNAPEPGSVVRPEVTGEAAIGQRAYAALCASCHGEVATGTDRGPPFLHPFYLPDHHGDQAFLMAAEWGVRAHHWRFGDMPPVEGVTRADVKAIVAFVRALQRANGMLD
ncbi:c-type cytochrome [Frigidibacter sp. MR17.24]|uniref:c-type cytochrome n=1 Tax=Frigidibacter sp. MR17.24 TaxID=3127345 RepID=UPI0030130545